MNTQPSSRGYKPRVLAILATTALICSAMLFGAARSNTNWLSRATRSCIEQTWADWLAYDPNIGNTVTIKCTDADAKANPPKKCWTCEDPNSATHHVLSGGAGGMGDNYITTDCGKMKEGTCKIVDGAPVCDNPQIKPNFFCSVAQVQKTQAIEP